jgi:hypothetical protein
MHRELWSISEGEATAASGGLLRVRRGIRWRADCDSCPLILPTMVLGDFLIMVASGLALLLPTGRLEVYGVWMLTGIALWFFLLLAVSIWTVFTREEWLVGPDLLQVHRCFCGFHWDRCYTSASLHLSQNQGVWCLFVQTGAGLEQLTRLSRVPARKRAVEELFTLAHLLSAVTRWPLRVPVTADDSQASTGNCAKGCV